jgi:hypothetical protein
MAAIITENYRKSLAKLLDENLQDPINNYYIGIGKSDEWYEDLSGGLSAPFPQGTTGDSLNLLGNLTDLIKMSFADYSRVIPNVNPTTVASYYKKFDPYDASCLYPSTIGGLSYKPAYFIEPSNGNVFLVLDAPTTATTLAVTSADPIPYTFFLNGNTGDVGVEMITTTSGYTIVCIGNIDPNSKFNNSQFVGVEEDLNTSGTLKYKGVVYGFHVANGGVYSGDGTSVAGTVTVYESGSTVMTYAAPLQIPVLCTIFEGKITSVRPTSAYYSNLATNASALSGFSFKKPTAKIAITDEGITQTTEATIYPNVSNTNGFKYDMTEYTPAWYVCFLANTDVSSQDVYTKYSQVSLIRNPTLDGATSILNVAFQNMKKSFTLAGYTASSIDETYSIVQKNSSSQIVKRLGTVDSYKQNGDDVVIYYTNSAKHGFDKPLTTSGNTIVFVSSTGVETATSIVPSSPSTPTVNTADVLFIDNRATINRSADQNEELKIIIQL